MRGTVLAGIGAGLVSWFVPPGLVDEVIAEARAAADAEVVAAGGTLRVRRLRALPPRLGVYFVLGLCLSSQLPYRDVLRGMAGGLSGALAEAGWAVPAATALTRLRSRLGSRPFELLFWRVTGTLLPGTAPWSHVRGLLAVAWDGTTVKVPDSPQNAAWFGRQQDGYPKARLVALVACGTRGLLGAALGPMTTGEGKLAGQLTAQLGKGMLLLADRGFYSWQLWTACAASGAHLLWRLQAGLHLPVVTALPDGSFLSFIDDPREKANRYRKNWKRRKRGAPPDAGPLPGRVTVRVITFTVTADAGDGTARTELYRMITTLTDWRAYPAAELAAAYARRWAVETAFRELKTSLRGNGRILRSRTPDLARQEIWAYLAVYQAIRAVIACAGAGAGLDPARISFTTVLNAVRGTIATPASHQAALAQACGTALAALVPDRAGRVCLRAVREPRSLFPGRGNATNGTNGTQAPISQRVSYTVTITPPAPATRAAPDQQKQPGNQANQPP
jgi:hypothetical protein